MRKKISPLLKKLTYFSKTEDLTEHSVVQGADRDSEQYYRDRWQHDKVVKLLMELTVRGPAVGRYM